MSMREINLYGTSRIEVELRKPVPHHNWWMITVTGNDGVSFEIACFSPDPVIPLIIDGVPIQDLLDSYNKKKSS